MSERPTEAPEAEALLAIADALARDLVRAAAPVRFATAAEPEEREAVFRLRYRTVVEQGWADEPTMPEGLERDHFDETAVQVGGWDAGLLVACARLVYPSGREPLPTEEAFGVEALPRGQVVDVGRGIVASGYRDEEGRVFIGLLATCWLELHARGFWRMCGDAALWLIDTYRGMGFQVQVIGDGRTYWGEWRYPILVDGLASVRSVMERLTPGAGGRESDP